MRSISFKVENASDDAIDLMDRMLNLNPKKRPSVDEILAHPYFAHNPEIVNPFTSPCGTPERVEAFSSHNYFSEPVFGKESVPIFGSSNKGDSPRNKMECSYSPVGRSDLVPEDLVMNKKSNSMLNEGDGLPADPKYSHSYEKIGMNK